MACTYNVTNSAGEVVSFNTKEEALKYAKDNDLASNPKKGAPSRDTTTLADVLRQVAFGENNFNPQQLRSFQEEMLDEFIRMEEQSQFFYKMGSAIALTKGLGKNFDQMQGVKKNLHDLGIGMSPNEFETAKIPIDVRYLITGDPQYRVNNETYYHKITANNIDIMNKVGDLSKTIFMEQTPSFVNHSDKVIANLKEGLNSEKVREIKDDFTAFLQIASYKKWIEMNDKRTSTLRNTLIYDGGADTIVDIVKQANKLAPDNMFLKFILPVSTTTKVGKRTVKNINNKDLINTIEGKTRGKLEPDIMASLMDSFTELYLNPRTQYHAKALFDYLIVKDGLMFKNKSFIKMIPTMMFEDISKATDIATKLMSLSEISQYSKFIKELDAQRIVDREGNYKPYFTAAEKQQFNDLFRSRDLNAIKNRVYEKVFGLDYNGLYNRFEQIYATDVKYQFNLQFVRTRIKGQAGNRYAKGISVAENNGVKELKITMFTDAFKKTEKGSEARSKEFKDTMDDLEAANITSVKIDENKSNLQFKKFIRVRQGDNYVTYKLVKVSRENSESRTQDYFGNEMTVVGDLIPSGTTAIYHTVEPVGASNSSGVADLGTRPTREQTLEAVNAKTKRDDNTPPPAAPPANPVTPSGGGTPVSGGTYTGQITSLGENQIFVFGSNPIGVNGNLQNNTGGAALSALKNSWVEQGEKMDNKLSETKKSWGLTTVTRPGAKRSMTPEQIIAGVEKLYKFAYGNLHKQFLVAYMGKTGTNLNGYSNQEMADMFSTYKIPPNMIFEKDFSTLLNRGGNNQNQSTNPTPTSPLDTETVSGGMFGGLNLMSFDPNDADMSGMDISPDDIQNTIKKIDKC